MRIAAAFLACWCLLAAGDAVAQQASGAPPTLSRVRVTAPAPAALAAELAAAGFDVLREPAPAATLELIVSDPERRALEARGLTVEFVARGRPFAEIQAELQAEWQAAQPGDGTPPSGYLDRPGVEAALAALAAAHPERAELVDLTTRYGQPATAMGNHLYALRLGDDVSAVQDEPAVLIVSCHHARELVTPVIALDHARRLLEGYGNDPAVTAAVDAHEIWIAPLWNPDGYDHVFAVDNNWRKNRADFGPAGIGVDLNRNYPFGWDSVCAGSTLPSSSTYKGPAAGSEVETATMLAFAADRRFAKVLDFHSPGQEVLYGYACAPHPLTSFLFAEAAALSQASGYGGDVRPPSAEGEQHEWQLAAFGAYAFLTETATLFQPAHAVAEAEAVLVWPGTLHWLQRPISLSGHVVDACSNLPLEAQIEVTGLTYLHGESLESGGASGRYHLFLPDGSWTVEFTAPGYADLALPITVSAGGGQLADVALTPLAPSTGCWTDLGFALAGTHGEPRLEGSGTLTAGAPTTLALTGALENGLTWLVVGVARLDLHPFYGGTLVPDIAPPGFFAPLPTDADGAMVFAAPWPVGIPSGFELYFQHWVVDPGGPYGFAASNALEAVAP